MAVLRETIECSARMTHRTTHRTVSRVADDGSGEGPEVTWFKVDDSFYDHRKVRLLGRAKLPALGLWITCGTWSSGRELDGFVPRGVVKDHDQRYRYAAHLVAAGLWFETTKNGERGYQFHDWQDYQPTAADLEELRRKRADAGRVGGIKSGQTRRKPEASA